MRDIRALAEAALSKRGPWCGYCGEAFSTREPELARFALAVLDALDGMSIDRSLYASDSLLGRHTADEFRARIERCFKERP